jgi:hypothetical protein
MFRQSFHEITISTRGRGLYEFTSEVEKWIVQNKFRDGLLTIHLQHTSASLLIQENASPDVRRDFEKFFERLVPDGDAIFEHTIEGGRRHAGPRAYGADDRKPESSRASRRNGARHMAGNIFVGTPAAWPLTPRRSSLHWGITGSFSAFERPPRSEIR